VLNRSPFPAEEPFVPTLDAAACAALMDGLTRIAARAAQKILDLAGRPEVRTKADGSPVTAADEAAEAMICEGLQQLAPALPIISEERAGRENPPATGHGSYFLVDPLDGTREFIAGRDEYTINIALMSAGAPLLGLITAPALGLTWRGIAGLGAERLALGGGTEPNSSASAIHPRPRPAKPVIMVSRSHLDARTQAYLGNLPQQTLLTCGSSIKFCRLAEGAADLYPRLAPTRDWDVAAGHAILKAAGGAVTAPDGSALRYGTPGLLIPAFIAAGQAPTA
jgi:3'(2'), 5'-bisphosphate nucleotidase